MNIGSIGSKKFRQAMAKVGIGPAIGDIKESMLTEEEFQKINGDSWILMDGRDVTGSDYAKLKGLSSIPDGRGVFRRAKNNGRTDGNQNPDGDLALGTFKGDAIRNISGIYSTNYKQMEGTPTGPFYNYSSDSEYTISASGTGSGGGDIGFDASRQVPTAADNRPKSITVNVFIKVNW